MKFIAKAIGELTNNKIVRGRENVPKGDDFSWWSCHFEYRNRNTSEAYTLEELQDKYELGFGQKELWDFIECEYNTEEVYVMNVNHPRYKEK